MNTRGAGMINFILIFIITAIIFVGVMYLMKGDVPFGISRSQQTIAEPVMEEALDSNSEEAMEDSVEAIDEENAEDVAMEDEDADAEMEAVEEVPAEEGADESEL